MNPPKGDMESWLSRSEMAERPQTSVQVGTVPLDLSGIGLDAGPPVRYAGGAVVGDGRVESSLTGVHAAAVVAGAEGEFVAVEDLVVGSVQGPLRSPLFAAQLDGHMRLRFLSLWLVSLR